MLSLHCLIHYLDKVTHDRSDVGSTFVTLESGKCMVCELTLRKGFTVRGEASCVSKENFDVVYSKSKEILDTRSDLCISDILVRFRT